MLTLSQNEVEGFGSSPVPGVHKTGSREILTNSRKPDLSNAEIINRSSSGISVFLSLATLYSLTVNLTLSFICGCSVSTCSNGG